MAQTDSRENNKPTRRAKSGQGTFFKRNNRWVGEISLGVDKSGKRIRRTFYGDTLKSVQEQAASAIKAHNHATLAYDGNTAIEQFMGEWLIDKKQLTRPNTFLQYEWIVRGHIVPELGAIKVAQLTVRQVDKFLLLKWRTLSATTVGYIFSVLHNAFENAVRYEFVSRNVIAHARQPGGDDKPHKEIEFLPDLAKRLVVAFEGHRHQALFTVLVGLGLRISEALGLSWDDVHLDDEKAGPWLRVRQQLQHKEQQYRLTEPKSKAARRNLSIPPFAAGILREHRKAQADVDALRAGSSWKNEWNLVFTNEDGGALDVSRVRKHFVKLLSDKGFARMRLHDCRHLCASLLISQNTHPRMVMAILGHTQISLSMEHYGHVVTTEMRGAADALDAVFSPEELGTAPESGMQP